VSEKDLYDKLTKTHLVWSRDELSRQLANVNSIHESMILTNKIIELNNKIAMFEKESNL
jgi:hypothetical protein